LREINFVGDVPLAGAPSEKLVEYFDAVFLGNDPVALEGVILGHFTHMFLHEIIHVFAEGIHIGLGNNLFRVLFVYYVLQEQHEQQVERLEFYPLYPWTHQLGELEEAIGHADVPVGVVDGGCPGVQVDVYL